MKRLSNIFGISPLTAARLEQTGLRTTSDLAAVENLPELSLRADVPIQSLRDWQHLARQEVASSHFRQNLALILSSVAFLALAIVSGTFYYRSRQVAARRLLDSRGWSSYEKGDFAAAIAAYRQLVARVPKDALAHDRLGLALAGGGFTQESMIEFRKSLALDPRNADHHSNLCLLLAKQEKYAEALAECKEA